MSKKQKANGQFEKDQVVEPRLTKNQARKNQVLLTTKRSIVPYLSKTDVLLFA